MKKTLSIFAVVLMLTLSTAALAQQAPVENVSGKHHPNLAAAQHLTEKAYQKIMEAQSANEFDMGGHAQQAKDLLDQANTQLKLAAETANKH